MANSGVPRQAIDCLPDERIDTACSAIAGLLDPPLHAALLAPGDHESCIDQFLQTIQGAREQNARRGAISGGRPAALIDQVGGGSPGSRVQVELTPNLSLVPVAVVQFGNQDPGVSQSSPVRVSDFRDKLAFRDRANIRKTSELRLHVKYARIVSRSTSVKPTSSSQPSTMPSRHFRHRHFHPSMLCVL